MEIILCVSESWIDDSNRALPTYQRKVYDIKYRCHSFGSQYIERIHHLNCVYPVGPFNNVYTVNHSNSELNYDACINGFYDGNAGTSDLQKGGFLS